MSDGERLASAAAALVGVPFRLHGRDPSIGVDCVGLVAAALAGIGRTPLAPQGYGLRNRDIRAHIAFAAANRFLPARGRLRPGDLLLITPGAAQHHLLIALSQTSFVHAHAGLRRVVRQDGHCEWPVLQRWRLDAPR